MHFSLTMENRLKINWRKTSQEAAASNKGYRELGEAVAVPLEVGTWEMFRRKDPQNLGWMCGGKEREESAKFLVAGWDNLVEDDVTLWTQEKQA